MNRIFMVGLIVMVWISPVWADDAADVKAAIEEHYKLFQTGQDDESLRFHLDDFTMFLADGGLLWESDFNEVSERMGATLNIAPRGVYMTDYNAKIYDDVAVVTFYLVGTVDEEPVTNRVSAVWVRTDDGWREAHHHESPLQPGGTP